MLESILTKTLRDQRRSVVGWVCGLSFLVLLTVAFWPSVEGDPSLSDFTEDLPEGLQAVVGSDISSPEGYLNSQLFTFMLPLLIAVLAIGKAAGTLAGEEQSGQLELLLSQPVTRASTVIEKGTAVFGVVAVVVLATFLVTVGGMAAFGMDVGVSDLVAAHLGLAPSGSCSSASRSSRGRSPVVGGRRSQRRPWRRRPSTSSPRSRPWSTRSRVCSTSHRGIGRSAPTRSQRARPSRASSAWLRSRSRFSARPGGDSTSATSARSGPINA
jgi:ABC-2 family transporter protein